MKSFQVSARQAAFGWPLYITRNLVAYTAEHQCPAQRAKVAAAAILFALITTAAWAAVWLAGAWMMLRLMGFDVRYWPVSTPSGLV